jgi:SAM-dependent methyltransferase
VVNAVQFLLAQQPEAQALGPFARWFLGRKFAAMEKVFRANLFPGCKFLDMGCGSADALVLAKICCDDCEMWGLDIDAASLEIARRRLPSANLHCGDMHDPASLPKGYFDVVHEYGAAFLARDWGILVRNYLSLLKDGGVLLWELPQKWSTAHISYLLRRAPKRGAEDTKIRRIIRSFSPWKVRFESDRKVLEALQATGFDLRVQERVPVCYFFCRGFTSRALDWAGRKFGGDKVFETLDRATGRIVGRSSGYYLVIRKGIARQDMIAPKIAKAS